MSLGVQFSGTPAGKVLAASCSRVSPTAALKTAQARWALGLQLSQNSTVASTSSPCCHAVFRPHLIRSADIAFSGSAWHCLATLQPLHFVKGMRSWSRFCVRTCIQVMCKHCRRSSAASGSPSAASGSSGSAGSAGSSGSAGSGSASSASGASGPARKRLRQSLVSVGHK